MNNKSINNELELHNFIEEKTKYIQEIIRNTIISIKKNTYYEIFSNNDINLSISVLNEIYAKSKDIMKSTNKDSDKTIDSLQKIIDKLSMLICGFGTKKIEDLLFISFGSEFKNIKITDPKIQSKFELICEYVQPTGYKVINWKQLKINSQNDEICCNKITDEIIKLEDANMFECFDLEKTNNNFYQKIHGIRVIIQNEKQKKTLVINGIIEDIDIECFSNFYIDYRISELKQIANTHQENEKKIINRIIETLSLKDILIYGNNDIQKKVISVITDVNSVKQSKIDITVKKFMDLENYYKRDMLINLLLCNDDEILYVCYLLYDLITANSIDSNEKNEQMYIYNSLPWKIKEYFKEVVKYTIKYTNDIMQKYDVNKISLEQQIYLLKVNDIVKDKAITKLKEIKGNTNEGGTKAKQYLEGLIKIPFGMYKEEPILKKIKNINSTFLKINPLVSYFFPDILLTNKEKYTIIEILEFIRSLEIYIKNNIQKMIENNLENLTNRDIMNIVQYINIIKKNNGQPKIPTANQKKSTIIKNIKNNINENKSAVFSNIIEIFDKTNPNYKYSLSKSITEINKIKTDINEMEKSMEKISEILDDSIYSHLHAKNQIMKIIAQWINGEQTGYCFGFEGSPGIGKTSLAKKGLSNCLTDENGISRPFAFIALGGSSNGSTLEGHGYTYINSSWGKIVDILMETKCMNPIIYIDELDKVSKTEHGREIISIFTHLIDSTQNDVFQDKYFSGIEIDLSKALFIFSYNDPDQIDRILLDRIHRIKFENLTLKDKLEIVKKFILPEINKKMGFENIVFITDDLIEYIIYAYTIEPGVRKLKEILFDLYGEINLELLKNKNETIKLPIEITREKLEAKYLSKYQIIQYIKVHNKSKIGIINGLWANSLGRGGIIPIQTLFYPSSTFLNLQLTGLQGDVMKESMNVAKTLAWNLTNNETKKKLLKHFEETKCQGLHIHCPEGAISKDGPSAGAAITTAIYSLFNEIQIKNDIAITGEISLSGEITAIGGLDIKIIGGIRAGVKTFLYPKTNTRDFNEWKNKYKTLYNDIDFYEVSNIQEVFDYAFV
uniref:Lon proteolytic domain-containing protein n=1 Tax=viral metagenome TaxID=1070528 RepID=A0A6C0DBS5_9ZZZZ